MTDNERTERERVARAIWHSNFHPDDVASGEADRRIAEWPSDWAKAQRQADAAIAALRPTDSGLVEDAEGWATSIAQHLCAPANRDAAVRLITNALVRYRATALRAQGQDERAEIVAWLRADADLTEAEAVKIVRNTTGDPRKNAAEWAGLVATKRGIADAIEAGQHQTKPRQS